MNKCLSFVVETGKEISKEKKSFEGLFCGKSGSKENNDSLLGSSSGREKESSIISC